VRVNRDCQVWSDWTESVPFDFWEADLDTADPAIAASCREWMASLRDGAPTSRTPRAPITCGFNLLLTGAVGSGKTWAAFGVCKELRWVGHPMPHKYDLYGPPPGWDPAAPSPSGARWWASWKLLAELRKDDSLTMEYIESAAVVFLDDVGSVRQTEWTTDQFYAVLDLCRSANKPVIATTNLQLPNLEEYLGPAGFSRLVDGAVVLELHEENRRKRAS